MDLRLRRVSDLFNEGTELYLGQDGDQKPVVLWINKLNSFEVEESRRDGAVRRGERLAELSKPDSPEFEGLRATVALWSDDELREQIVKGKDDELMLKALDDLETDPKFREAEDYVRRGPALLRDEDVDSSDPRYAALEEANATYMTAISQATVKLHRQEFEDLAGVKRHDLAKAFYQQWRERVTLEDFMSARRLSEIYLATRDCYAVDEGTELGGERIWNHDACDHAQRFFSSRAVARTASEALHDRILKALSDLTSSYRESGNSDAPGSSSGPSEQSSDPEAASTPSSLDGTSPAVLTT
jgi:hypothetical protein